jgi:hypothetical protein
MKSRCLGDDKPWQLRYFAAFVAILGFGIFALSLGVNPVGFRLQTIFFILLFGIILLPLFEVWWRDCKPTQRSTRT